MSQIEVQIMGQGYLLSCPIEGEALMVEAVRKVDAAMCKIRDAGKVRARDRIAVLASLNLAMELHVAQDELARLKAQLAQANAELQTLREQAKAHPPAPAAALPPSGGCELPTELLAQWVARIDRALDAGGQPQ